MVIYIICLIKGENHPFTSLIEHWLFYPSERNVCLHICWFVNDVRQIKSKNLTVFEEGFDVIGRRLPVKRTHREIIVFSAVNS